MMITTPLLLASCSKKLFLAAAIMISLSACSSSSGGGGGGEKIAMITPFVNQSDMSATREAFSASSSAPWGFAHDGIDFFPSGNLKPFHAVCSGKVSRIDIRNKTSNDLQVEVLIECNSTYSVTYDFEPMTSIQSDIDTQLANILVTKGQSISQGDLIGNLLAPKDGSHVHFGLLQEWNAICPDDFFTAGAKTSILALIHMAWPGAGVCY